jgi:hypothetical protein
MSMEIGIDRSQRVAPAGIAAADLPSCDWPWPENTATVTSRMAVIAQPRIALFFIVVLFRRDAVSAALTLEIMRHQPWKYNDTGRSRL